MQKASQGPWWIAALVAGTLGFIVAFCALDYTQRQSTARGPRPHDPEKASWQVTIGRLSTSGPDSAEEAEVRRIFDLEDRGDTGQFRLLRRLDPTASSTERPLAAQLQTPSGTVTAVRFPTGVRLGRFYDLSGTAIEHRFLATPLAAHGISSSFGRRANPLHQGLQSHHGLDFAAPEGAPVRSVGAGLVTFAGWRGEWGNLVVVTHGNGLETRYAHLSSIDAAVLTGAPIERGARIGAVGHTGAATGPHLHFECRINGRSINPFALDQVEPVTIGAAEREHFAAAVRLALPRLSGPSQFGPL